MKKTLRLFLLPIFSFLTFAAAAQNYYTVKFPDDITVTGCGATVPATNPTITMQSTCAFGVGVSIKDQIFYTNDIKTCGKIFRRFRLLYWCDYDPNWPSPTIIPNPSNSDLGPTVIGNAVNHGYLEYTQVIKFLDNQPPIFLDCPASPQVFCDFSQNDPAQWHTNHIDLCEGKVDLKVKVTDACSKTSLMLSYLMWLDLNSDGIMETFVKSADATAWPIETTKNADTLTAWVKFPTGFEMPYGKHKIEWIANDNCGNQAVCKYEFVVKDCAPPTVVCLHGLSVNIMPTGMITLWDVDFLKYALDNCTPAHQLKFGIRKKGAGTGFPTGQNGVTFTCDELGKQEVELWAADAAGNAAFCVTYLDVQDPFGDCPIIKPVLKGTISTLELPAEPMAGVQIWFEKQDSAVQNKAMLLTDSTGKFDFQNLTNVCDGRLRPVFEDLKNAGVTTLDLLLLLRVLDGTYTLPTPERLLAADLNSDGKLDFDDISEIVQVIVNPDAAFPKGKAWQFLPKNYQFPQPANPFAAPVPDFLKIECPANFKQQHDFVAIKKGDLDGSAASDPLLKNRDVDKSLVFTAADRSFSEGEIFEVEIRTPSLLALPGFQFSLNWNPEFLVLENALPGLVAADALAVFSEKNQLAASWGVLRLPSDISAKNPRRRALTLIFRAKQAGLLSEVLRMTDEIARSEGYTLGLDALPALLQIDLPKGNDLAKFFNARPNPTATGQTEIPFSLAEATEVHFSILNAQGFVVASMSQFLPAGDHVQFLDFGENHGLLFVEMLAGSIRLTQRIVID